MLPVPLKAVLTNVWPLEDRRKEIVQVFMVNMLSNHLIVMQPEDMEKQEHPTGHLLLATC